MTRRSPLAFFALTLLLSVPFLILGAVMPGVTVIGLPLSALQFVAPAVAAVVLVARAGGWRDTRRLLGNGVEVSRGRRLAWAVPMVALMPAIYGISSVLMRLFGRPLPPPQISVASVLALLVLFLVSGFCEEIGWTGYVLDPIRERVGAFGAALLIGAVWALFHVVADLQGGHELGWVLWHRVASVLLRVLIVWVYVNAGEMLGAAVVVHAMDNVSWSSFPVGGSHYDPAFLAPVSAGVVLLVTWLWGSRTLARFRFERGRTGSSAGPEPG